MSSLYKEWAEAQDQSVAQRVETGEPSARERAEGAAAAVPILLLGHLLDDATEGLCLTLDRIDDVFRAFEEGRPRAVLASVITYHVAIGSDVPSAHDFQESALDTNAVDRLVCGLLTCFLQR